MRLLIFIVIIFLSPFIQAQVQTLENPENNLVFFESIGFLGLRDNLDNFYAKPLSEKLRLRLSNEKTFQFIINKDLEINPLSLSQQERQNLIEKNNWQGALWGEYIKNQESFQLRILLFDKTGHLFLINEETFSKRESLDILNQRVNASIQDIFSRLPYQTWILSRKENLVTINYGKNQGAAEGQRLNAVFISQLIRHPRFEFVTEFKKELIGSIVILKVEDNLSFASVTEERYSQLLKPKTKLEIVRHQSYPPLIKQPTGEITSNPFSSRGDDFIVGQNPKEWIPIQPQFGFLGFGIALGQPKISQNLNVSGNRFGSSPLLPSLFTKGELWLTSHWTLSADLLQSLGSLQVSNAQSSDRLDYQSTHLRVGGSYRFYFSEDDSKSFIAPGLKFNSLYHKIESTSPIELTSLAYGSLNFSLEFRLALPASALAIGAMMNLPLSVSVEESPVTSGNSVQGALSHFGLYGEYFLQPMKSLFFGVDFFQQQTSFSGIGSRTESATSHSSQLNQLSLGLHYYF